jgi:hypothetical protein
VKRLLNLKAIYEVLKVDPEFTDYLSPLIEYVYLAINFLIQKPRSGTADPLLYEMSERLLPDTVNDAYAYFTFFSHGLLDEKAKTHIIQGEVFVEVED